MQNINTEGNRLRTNAVVASTSQSSKYDEKRRMTDTEFFISKKDSLNLAPKKAMSQPNKQKLAKGVIFTDRGKFTKSVKKKEKRDKSQVHVIPFSYDRPQKTPPALRPLSYMPSVQESIDLCGLGSLTFPETAVAQCDYAVEDDLILERPIFDNRRVYDSGFDVKLIDTCILFPLICDSCCYCCPIFEDHDEHGLHTATDDVYTLLVGIELIEAQIGGFSQMFSMKHELSPEVSDELNKLRGTARYIAEKGISISGTLEQETCEQLRTLIRDGKIAIDSTVSQALDSLSALMKDGSINIVHNVSPQIMEVLGKLKTDFTLEIRSPFEKLFSLMGGQDSYEIRHFITDMVRIIAGFVMIANAPTAAMKMLFVTATALSLNLSALVLNRFIESFVLPGQQSLVDSCYNLFLSLIGLKEMPMKEAGQSARDISAHLNLFRDVGKFLAFFHTQVEEWHRWLYAVDTVEEREYNAFFKELSDWTLDVQTLFNSDVNYLLSSQNFDFVRWEELRTLGKSFLQTVSRSKVVPAMMSTTFMRLLSKMDDLNETVEAYKQRSTLRPKPIFMWLYGVTAQGKSRLVNSFCQSLFRHVYPDRPHVPLSEIVYFRNPKEDFWDGYTGQFATVWDDPFQNNDYAKWREIQADLLHFSDATPRKLQMAELHAKKGTYFRSQIVIVTTNTKLAQMCTLAPIESPEALLRRVDYNIDVRLDKTLKGHQAWTVDLYSTAKDPSTKTYVETKKETITVSELASRTAKLRKAYLDEERIFSGPLFDIPIAQMDGVDDVPLSRSKEEMSLDDIVGNYQPGSLRTDDITLTRNKTSLNRNTGRLVPTNPQVPKDLFKDFPALFEEFNAEKVCWTPYKGRVLNNLELAYIDMPEVMHPIATMPVVYRSDFANVSYILTHVEMLDRQEFPSRKGPESLMFDATVHCTTGNIDITAGILPIGLFKPVPWRLDRTDRDSMIKSMDACFATYPNILTFYPALQFHSPLALFKIYARRMIKEGIIDNETLELFCQWKVRQWTGLTALPGAVRAATQILDSSNCAGPFLHTPSSLAMWSSVAKELGYRFADMLLLADMVIFPEWYQSQRLSTIVMQDSSVLSEWNAYMAYDWSNLKIAARKYAKPVLFGATAIGLLYGGYKLMQYARTKTDSDSDEEVSDDVKHGYIEQSDDKQTKHVPVKRTEYRKRVDTRPKAQMSDTDSNSMISRIHEVNLCRITRGIDGRQVGASTHCLFVKGKHAIVPAHFMYVNLPHQDFLFFFSDRTVSISRSFVDICGIGEDLMLLTISDPTFQPRRDILKYFMEASSITRIVAGTVAVPFLDANGLNQKTMIGPFSIIKNQIYDALKPAGESIVTLSTGVRATLPSQGGHCGCPYVLQDPNYRAKIFAIHIAGIPATGIAIGHIISREEIISAMSNCAASAQSAIEWPTEFEYVREATEFEVSYPPRVTQLLPTPLLDKFGPNKFAPARLSKFTNEQGERVDPLMMAIQKANKPLKPFTDEELGLYQRVLEAYFRRLPQPECPVRVFSLHEAINGLPNEPWFTRITLQASPGNFWKVFMAKHPKQFPQQSRRNLFTCMTCQSSRTCDCVPSNLTPCSQLLEAINLALTTLKAGEIPDWLFEFLLKDELRDLDRVKAGKTRLFGGGPLEAYIIMRMYFGAFMLDHKKQHLAHFTASGLNPHSTEWGEIVRHIRPTDDFKIIAGDLSGQDTSQRMEAHMIQTFCINKWYADHTSWVNSEDAEIRRTLTYAIHDTHYVLFNDVVRFPGRNPSGQAKTNITNDLDNIAIHGICAVRHSREHPEVKVSITPENFFDFFKCFVMGDDHVIGTSYPGYTHKHIAVQHARLGYIYTAVDKGDVLDRLYDISEVNFLQRSFRKDGPYWFAPLSLEKIINICYWRMKSTPVPVAIQSAFQSMLVELFHHGPQVYDEWRSKLLLAWKEQNFMYHLVTYDYNELFEKFTRGVLDDPWAPGVSVPLDYHSMSYPIPQMQMDKGEAEIENTSQTTAELTKVTDAEPPIASSNANSPFDFAQFDPYIVDTTPKGVLERQYEIGSVSWASTVPSLTALTQYSMPRAYFNSVPLADYLYKRYTNFSFDIELQFRLNTTIYHRGQIALSYIPLYNSTSSFYVSRASAVVTRVSGADVVLLDASTKNPVVVTCPMLSPFTGYYYDWLNNTTYAGIGGSIYVDVLVPLTRTDAVTATSAVISVYASLRNVRAYGAVGQSGDEVITRAIAQMDRSDAMLSRAKTQQDALLKEAKSKVSLKLSTVADGVGSVSSMLSTVPQLSAPMTAVSAISKMIGMGAAAFGNSKSRDLEGSSANYPTPFPHSSLANGVNMADLMALSTDARVGSDNLFPDDINYDLWMNYGMRPSFMAGFTVSSAQVHGALLYEFVVTPARRNMNVTTPPLLQSMFSTYWRGSMQYQLDICAATMDQFRIRVVYFPPGREGLTVTDGNVGDFITHVVDIQGRTTFRFSVPYLGVAPYAYCGSPAEDGSLGLVDRISGTIKIYLDIPLLSFSTTATTVTCTLWYACGADMQFAVPRKAWGRPDLVAEAQGDTGETIHLVKSFRDTFPALIDAKPVVLSHMAMSEVIPSWSSIFRRPHFAGSITIGKGETLTLDVKNYLFQNNYAVGWLAAIFQCLRGGLVLHFLPFSGCEKTRFTFSLHNSTVIPASNNDWGQGAVYSDYLVRQNASIQIPQFQRGLFMTANWVSFTFSPTFIGVSALPDDPSAVDNADLVVLVSLGDDFTLATPSSLPRWI